VTDREEFWDEFQAYPSDRVATILVPEPRFELGCPRGRPILVPPTASAVVRQRTVPRTNRAVISGPESAEVRAYY
jgi:hypothetical protein